VSAASPPFRALRNRHGERLDFAFHPSARRAVVVIAHGVTSDKERPYLVELAAALERAGVASLRFSFSGNGGSEGRFEEATLAKEVEDLGSVLDAVAAAGFERIALAGHSMGAAVGMLRAESDARIRALVSLAGMFHVARFFERHFGRLEYGSPLLGKPACPWNRSLAEDAARVGSLQAAAARVAIPWLLVHGSADEMVPLQDSLDARSAAAGRPELAVLEGADHRFTGAIPRLTAAVVPWLARESLR
jgi:alpha/beta superfamily hydrolase